MLRPDPRGLLHGIQCKYQPLNDNFVLTNSCFRSTLSTSNILSTGKLRMHQNSDYFLQPTLLSTHCSNCLQSFDLYATMNLFTQYRLGTLTCTACMVSMMGMELTMSHGHHVQGSRLR